MRSAILAALLMLLIGLLPWAAPGLLPERAAAPSPSPAAEENAAAAETAFFDVDSSTPVILLRDGKYIPMSMAEYLPGVLAGEMPGDFSPEALRAQAVAARTYALRAMAGGRHPLSAVCGEGGCCQVWLDEEACRSQWGERYPELMGKMRAAAAATDGEYLSYQGEPILSCFHSSSHGYTESSAAVWGQALPYLVSVESPERAEDVPNFVTYVEISPEDFREVILRRYPEAELRDALPPDWLSSRQEDVSGRVAAIRVGGVSIPGTELRALFSLRSHAFTLTWTGHSFLFTVTGFGHGAGMSQYGANVMAKNGAGYREILAHYYPGAELLRWGA